jgi:hypothetical protein
MIKGLFRSHKGYGMEKNETTSIATDVLTVRQALDAMFTFLVQYYRETHSDDVGSLLGELPSVGALGTNSGDPAAWFDWLRAVQRALIPDTPEWRELIANLVADPNNIVGTKGEGAVWYGRILPDGSQLWAYVTNGNLYCAGCNRIPRAFDPKAGFSAASYDTPAPHRIETSDR